MNDESQKPANEEVKENVEEVEESKDKNNKE